MPTIRQLPTAVINKIAAGEVIERPASVVKELLENAVDSGASRIDATVVKGGTELIRVVDNGCGISADQLPLAIDSHATSKIEDADDLFEVATMGFRGEALASISEVSRVVIRSRIEGEAEGAELEVNGGHRAPIEPCGMPVGTVVEIRDLFFNTPVRRKFLKTPQTEFGHVTEAFNRIALAWPQVHFRLMHGRRVVHDLAPVERWKDRLVAIFGRELSEVLIPVKGESDQLRLTGYVADPTFSRSHSRMQYLLLNGRFIRDRALQHALAEAYRGLLLTGRFPVCFLRLEMPPDWVDVNVHPTKLEVRFQDSGQIYRHLLNTLRSEFLTTDLTARVGQAERTTGDVPRGMPIRPTSAPSTTSRLVTESPRGLSWDTAGSSSVAPVFGRGSTSVPRSDRWDFSEPEAVSVPASAIHSTPVPDRKSDAQADSAPMGVPVQRGLQFQNRYLVTEDEQGIVIIDQHALHERILYESLRERVLQGTLERQKLLVPETVHLRPEEYAAVIEAQELLAELGLDVEPFGGDSIVIGSYPAILGNVSAESVLRRITETLVAGDRPPDRRDLLDEILHMMACKAAVKAGDRLAQEEVEALLAQRHLCHDAHHCPHGRPTALVFTREELDRRFQRT